VAEIPPDLPGPTEGGRPERPGRLRGAAALRLHATLALGLCLCVAAFVIEVMRALGGNKLSWTYVFEWPLLAGFALYLWWHLFNGTDRRRPAPPTSPETPLETVDEPDPELEAWNQYLRTLDAGEAELETPEDGS
jgi:hypothetical protein